VGRLLERVAHRVLPGRIRRALKGPVRAAERRLLAGDRLTCPICEGRFRRFMSRYGLPDRQCPACHSLVRHRALWLYLERVVRIADRPMRILHFAPEPGIARRIAATGAEYVAGDVDPRPGVARIDVTAIPFPDASFDLVICSHVLEHVPDDRRAIRELARVLRPDGTALIVLPIKRGPTEEFVEPRMHADHDEQPGHEVGHRRTRGHGHVRRIGEDYVDRLRAEGFDVVTTVDVAARVNETDRARFAIEPGEPIFVCRHGE